MESIYDEIYPLTIVQDRYNGAYSGGKFIAWNLYPESVPEDSNGDDMDCPDFWSNNTVLCGKGDTPDSAVGDLYVKLVSFSKIKQSGIVPDKFYVNDETPDSSVTDRIVKLLNNGCDIAIRTFGSGCATIEVRYPGGRGKGHQVRLDEVRQRTDDALSYIFNDFILSMEDQG